MYYPSFYTTPRYNAFASTSTTPGPDQNAINKFLQQQTDAGFKPVPIDKSKLPIVTEAVHPGDTSKGISGKPVGQSSSDDQGCGQCKFGDMMCETQKLLICNIPRTLMGFDPCKTLGISGEACKYAPMIMLGVGALILFAVLKYII